MEFGSSGSSESLIRMSSTSPHHPCSTSWCENRITGRNEDRGNSVVSSSDMGKVSQSHGFRALNDVAYQRSTPAV